MNQSVRRPRPVVLCVLDGWGEADVPGPNAIRDARTPTWDRLMATCPHGLLDASEHHVGLPAGQMGNSEVGHMNLGAGRVVFQDLPRIDRAIADGSLARHPVLVDLAARLRASGGACHLMGLLSPGGVHSHQDHMAALARILAEAGVPVRVQALLDGRDTPPRSAQGYLAAFERAVAGHDVSIATVIGRYYAMDRDKRWERTERAFRALVERDGEHAPSAAEAVAMAYARGESDEFVAPTIIGGFAGMKDGDGLVMANFRADRVRQLLAALLDPGFAGFTRRPVGFAAAAGMVAYASALSRFLVTLFPSIELGHTFGEVVAEAGLRQLRIAETEKYAHVTFFFGGGREEPYPGEDRILVPSPKVATYDLAPAMSAPEVTDRLVAAIDAGTYDVIVVNYANADMVGHTGDHRAAVAAIEAVDACLGRLAEAVERAGGALLITADHGNAEQMFDAATGQPHTAHTSNRVPVILQGAPATARLRDGRLADVAPTLLALLGLPKPAEMTGQTLMSSRAAPA
ncbi:MAG: 2,3-bisphosphoglycerate-independent phosphoglycerate mutase, partial [Alphaproteobacteria bacterium]